MSASSLGQKLEEEKSLLFHREGVPLLVSPALLRSRGLGQIDLARMKKKNSWVIEIGEVKSSDVGVEVFLRGQRMRLFQSLRFLSSIFGAPSRLIGLLK